jgi:sugar O-acyltransferase (sialic acid O-acetyltransferase NeuD family)
MVLGVAGSASITQASRRGMGAIQEWRTNEVVRVETVVERIVIVGAGGHGREIVALAAACNLAAEQPIYDVVGVVDDGKPDLGRLERLSVPLIGPVEAVGNLDARYVIGIGSPSVRRIVDKRLVAIGASAAAPMIHPLAWVGLDVELAPGVIVCAGAIVTTNVRLGRHTHLNLQATVSHDCRIGEYVTVAPMSAISGNVTLEDEVELGTGVSVIPAVTIGRGSIVGAGAVVTQDIAPGMVAVGVPARSRPR